MANVLVTGGTGLIGWCVCDQLLRDGHRVVAYDLYPNYENVAGLGKGLEVVGGDITDLPRLLSTMRSHGVDHVVHLAAVITQLASQEPASAFRVNLGGTANIFDAALALGVRRVVWTSSITSQSVSPDYDNRPMGEDETAAGSSPYGTSKYACEVMAETYAAVLGLDVIGVRPSLTYGVGRLGGGTGIFNAAIRAIARGEPAWVSGSATLHEPMYNKDMAAFLVKALFGPKPEHRIFNAPCEATYDDAALVDAIRRVAPDAEVRVEPVPAYIPRVPVTNGARARAEIGFVPRYALEDGVREMIELFRAQDGARTG